MSSLAPPASAGPIADPAAIAADLDAQRITAQMRARNPHADPLKYLPDIHPGKIPRHVAIIMDGNGRWANQRGLPRVMGHRSGAAAVRPIIEHCGRLGIEVLTLYSFSIENWKRPSEEVSALMQLYVQYLEKELVEFMKENIRFVQIGRRDGLAPEVLAAADRMADATRNNTGATLCLAVNYGARTEIVDAVRAIARRAIAGDITPDQINDQTIHDHLYTAGLPDPDLLIRTAGEMRVSNYLLWQISYAELHVTDILWPDFGIDQLHTAIRDYAKRTRKFGGLADQKA
ncbi:MAG: isoprenyl transferase [Phycisphaerales bacterium]|nr:isoprenyl transferase [Phycisphaerales bacterium]